MSDGIDYYMDECSRLRDGRERDARRIRGLEGEKEALLSIICDMANDMDNADIAFIRSELSGSRMRVSFAKAVKVLRENGINISYGPANTGPK